MSGLLKIKLDNEMYKQINYVTRTPPSATDRIEEVNE